MTRHLIAAIAPSLLAVSACVSDHRIATLSSSSGDGGVDASAAVPDTDASAGAVEAAVGQFDVAPGQRFVRLGPGMALPSEASCAARVRRSGWEPRPVNAEFNQQVPTTAQLTPLATGTSKTGISNELGKRVTGSFVGTTDEILQWGACKWGFDEDYVRAFAARASNWRQNDWRSWSADAADCPADAETRIAFGQTECATIYGIFQISWRYHKTTWPMIHDSTAMNVDYALGYVRSCFEKFSSWLENSPVGKTYVAGDEWGCAGAYYSGNWYDTEGSQYMKDVQTALAKKPWTEPGF